MRVTHSALPILLLVFSSVAGFGMTLCTFAAAFAGYISAGMAIIAVVASLVAGFVTWAWVALQVNQKRTMEKGRVPLLPPMAYTSLAPTAEWVLRQPEGRQFA